MYIYIYIYILYTYSYLTHIYPPYLYIPCQAKGNWQKVELLMRLEGKATFLLCFHGNDKMPKAGGQGRAREGPGVVTSLDPLECDVDVDEI